MTRTQVRSPHFCHLPFQHDEQTEYQEHDSNNVSRKGGPKQRCKSGVEADQQVIPTCSYIPVRELDVLAHRLHSSHFPRGPCELLAQAGGSKAAHEAAEAGSIGCWQYLDNQDRRPSLWKYPPTWHRKPRSTLTTGTHKCTRRCTNSYKREPNLTIMMTLNADIVCMLVQSTEIKTYLSGLLQAATGCCRILQRLAGCRILVLLQVAAACHLSQAATPCRRLSQNAAGYEGVGGE